MADSRSQSPWARRSGEQVGDEVRLSYLERRRAKIHEEIQRNRRGEYKVPTWVMAVALVAMLSAWAALIVFS